MLDSTIIAICLVVLALCSVIVLVLKIKTNSKSTKNSETVSSSNTPNAPSFTIPQDMILLSKEEHNSLKEQSVLNKVCQEQYEVIKDELESLTHELTIEKNKHNDTKIALANIEADFKNLQEKLEQANHNLSRLEQQKEQELTKQQQQHADLLSKSEANFNTTLQELKDNHSQSINELKENFKREDELKAKTYQETQAKLEKLNQDNINKLNSENQQLKQQNEILQNELTEKTKELAKTTSEYHALENLRKDDIERFDKSQQILENKLNEMSTKLLNERTKDLAQANLENMSKTLNPLKDELQIFRELIHSTQKISSEQSGQLQNELKRLQESQSKLSDQANDLVKALRQGNKTQGMWGEHQLELVLDNAGLQLNQQYLREYSISEGENKGRVDVLVLLPNQHSIVIDAKCSLTAYTEIIQAEEREDHEAKKKAITRHLDSVKKHIDELSSRKYQNYTALRSPSFVFMFVPIDNALGLATLHDDKLYMYAHQKNVYLVSPSTLLPALRVVSNLWVLAGQNEKILKLSQAAHRIYEKTNKVTEHFEALDKARNTLNNNFDKFAAAFCEGKGNLRKLLENFSNEAPKVEQELLELISNTATTISNSQEQLESLTFMNKDLNCLPSSIIKKKDVAQKENNEYSKTASKEEQQSNARSLENSKTTQNLNEEQVSQLEGEMLAILEQSQKLHTATDNHK